MNVTRKTSRSEEAQGLGDRPAVPQTFRHHLAVKLCTLATLQAASMLLAPSAQAQSYACTQFSDTLAARIDPSIRGFTLETVPADAPVPAGAKVFGTCDGGAFKVLFRRGGNTRPVPSGASAAAPAPRAAVVADKPAPAPAPLPSPTPPPAPLSTAAAPAAPPPSREPEKPVGSNPSDAAAARTTEPAVAAAEPAPADSDKTSDAKASSALEEPGFMARYWPWILALLALPVAVWLWAWQAHRSAYDEAGLPRGPKIKF